MFLSSKINRSNDSRRAGSKQSFRRSRFMAQIRRSPGWLCGEQLHVDKDQTKKHLTFQRCPTALTLPKWPKIRAFHGSVFLDRRRGLSMQQELPCFRPQTSFPCVCPCTPVVARPLHGLPANQRPSSPQPMFICPTKLFADRQSPDRGRSRAGRLSRGIEDRLVWPIKGSRGAREQRGSPGGSGLPWPYMNHTVHGFWAFQMIGW